MSFEFWKFRAKINSIVTPFHSSWWVYWPVRKNRFLHFSADRNYLLYNCVDLVFTVWIIWFMNLVFNDFFFFFGGDEYSFCPCLTVKLEQSILRPTQSICHSYGNSAEKSLQNPKELGCCSRDTANKVQHIIHQSFTFILSNW